MPAEPHILSDDEVTELLIEYIKRQPDNIQPSANPHAQFAGILGYQLHTPEFQRFAELNRDLEFRAGELAHFLSIQGILMPMPGASGSVYRATAYGRQLLQQETSVVTDPIGYIALVEAIPGVDDLTVEYLAEATEAHRRFLDRSSAVMLGGAAENMLLTLATSLRDVCNRLAISPRPGLADWRISRVRNAVVETVRDAAFAQALEQALPGTNPLTEEERRILRELESTTAILAQFYADTRNDAGHPKPVKPARAVLYAYLKVFPEYASRVGTALTVLARVP